MRHPFVAKLFFFLLLVSSASFAASAQHKGSSQPVAYAYLGSSASQQDYSQGIITGYAVAADGSAQAISGFNLSGGMVDLTAASGFVFGVGNLGTTVTTYTRKSDGSLHATSTLDVIQKYRQGEDEYLANLNPDRSGKVLNVGAVWPNSDFVPFAIKSDGSLSYLGTTIGGCGKSLALLTFSPDNHWAYDACSDGYSKYGRLADGVLDGPFDFNLEQPPSPLASGACNPAFLSASVRGYIAVVWNGNSYGCSSSQGNMLATYAIDKDGNPTLMHGSSVVPQLMESGISFDPTGTYLALGGYVGNQTEGAVQVFELQSTGKLVALDRVILLPGITSVSQVRWDNAGHLYALGVRNDEGCTANSKCGLYIFNVTAQGVIAAPGSPHVVAQPVDVAVLPAK